MAASSPLSSQPFDALAPDAQLTTLLTANDANGTVIDLALHVRKSSAKIWDYHVLAAGEAPSQEVASGALHFNPNGSLHSVATTRALRFPNRAGQAGQTIDLDFGPSTRDGGTGVAGVTALDGASFEVWQQPDGAVLGCVPRATTPPLPTQRSPHCAGERTSAIWLGFNLDPGTPLGDAPAHEATVTVYDAALNPHDVTLRFRHVEAQRWQCDVTASGTNVGVVDLHFAENGSSELIENVPTVRLPLADGTVGPPIQLAFDQDGSGWTITSFPSPNHGWLAPNGAAPNTDGCVN